MIGTTLGPYRIDRELGAGGMGTVYLATVEGDASGSERGARVAVKVVHPQLLERPGFFKRFLREAELGRRVVHENVVRTVDVDALMLDGRSMHFLVMEFVEGRTLRSMLADLGSVPEALLRELAVQTAAGLTAIHAAGIVHRDLKPENILVTPDHQVRIMDLGVARLQEASVAITRQGQFAGSLLYAAPEQFQRLDVGAPADLYAIGVTLYELACGRNPFMAADTAGVIQAHIQLVPDRLDRVNDDVSPFLAEVVATLLEKDAAKRFESAEALREVLALGERSAWWAEREPAVLKARRNLPKIQVGRETSLHGREAEMALLEETWDRARRGHGATLLLEGEAGIGKTRLVDSFLETIAASTDAQIVYGSYPPAGGMGGLSDAVIARFGAANLAESLKPYLTVTPSLIPAFAALTKHEQPPTGAEPLQGDALHAVFVHLLRALAAEKPLVWVVDDLHFAAAESRKIVLSLARAVEGHRVLLLVTARPGLPEDELSHLARTQSFRRVNVARLSPRQVIELVRDAFKSDTLADRLGARIAWKSDGVPFFVFEMIRGLKEGRFLAEQPDGTYVETRVIEDIEVPSAVKDLIESRLKGFSKEDRALLDVGAVMGFEFDPGLVAMVLERKKVGVLQDLAEIERRTGVVRTGGGGCRFDHHQIQDVLYTGLMEDLRKEYHALLADAMRVREEIDPANVAELPGESAVFLAHHALRGSRPKAAAPFLDRALDHLGKGYLHAEVAEMCEQALAAKAVLVGERRTDALTRRAGALYALGRREEQIQSLRAAVATADALGDGVLRAKTRASAGFGLVDARRLEDAERVLNEAVDLARRSSDRGAEADAENGLGLLAWQRADEVGQRRCFERALELYREMGVRERQQSPVGNLGITALVSRGDLAEARDRYEEALAIARETGSTRGEALWLANLADLFPDAGRLDRAHAAAEEATALATSIGDRPRLAQIHQVRTRVAARSGDWNAAARLASECETLCREVGSPAQATDALVDLGRCSALAGRADAARDALARAVEIAEQAGDAAATTPARLRLALHCGGDREAALAAFAANESKIEFRVRMESNYLVFRLTGERARLAEAWRMLQQLRDHAPEDCRETVIANVPHHREIAAAAKEAGL